MEDDVPEYPDDYRSGYVALIGEPNVGKSTLMNAIMGAQISIVTRKPQTTRTMVLGIFNSDEAQILFLDTPGLISPKYLLQKAMMQAAEQAIADADIILHIADLPKLHKYEYKVDERLVALLRESGKPCLAALNKQDRVADAEKKEARNALESTGVFKAIHPISALLNEGIDPLLDELVTLLPVHPPYFPPEHLSDRPERFFVSEIIREKIFEKYKQEIPYSTEVVVVDFKEKKDVDYIAADIIVEKESQRKIVIGAKGAAIKDIGTKARADIEKFLGRKVYLELHVKYREGWRNDKNWIKRFGYGE
ncbi:MAG: GTPase Era [Ectothiorhodospiraceae bacterium]|nr:GTPase Era [Ectothiorhodospiraceae bacterium]